MNKCAAVVLAAGLLVGLPSVVAAQTQPGGKIEVKTADDLPRHTYKIEGKPSEFLLSDAPFKAFVTQVKADIEQDLAKYDIKDRTTLQSYYNVLLAIAMYEKRDADVLTYVEKIRELEAKQSKKLTTGLTARALVAASKEKDKARFAETFKRELKAQVKDLPWETVREAITQGKGRAEMVSRTLIIGGVQGAMDEVATKAGGVLSNDFAWGLINMRATLDRLLEVNPLVVEVYSEVIKSHEVAVKDVWTERLVTLTPDTKATPVVIAIWDSGVDTAIFSGQLFENPKEAANGKDDDNNGFVDDVHGIAYDLYSATTPELLHPVTDLQNDKALVVAHTKGLMDLQANIDSPERQALLAYIKTLKPDDVRTFQEDLGLFGNYAHGTHVAGIAAEGNPFARLLPVRITFDYKLIPTVTPSIEDAQKQAKAARDTVAYMRKAGVRVCNMSWGGSRKDIEGALEMKGVGENPEERAALSRKLFKIQRDALEEAMKSAPEILFVAAAGNSDNDNTFSELIPSGLNVPNMITIGAVDQGGKPTGFTTFGKNVTLYANGFEVNSYIPGGQKMKFSGTSMAAPNVANLAGKLLALNPKLTTEQVVELIRSGAEPMEGYEGRFVINPRKTVGKVAKN
ncbi:MAG TPA: S8 family serine peptidase [Phycisphaerales bacterium]|nr:S8 family serine peptidase [Phycisphaerales bacterium]